MFLIDDVQRKKAVRFTEKLDLRADLLARSRMILDLGPVIAEGEIRYEAGLFVLDYTLSYTITLASSRSMEPVELKESYPVNELFVRPEDQPDLQDQAEADLLLLVEGEQIDLADSAADNILLRIPLKVLTPEEADGAAFPEGEAWTVMSEEDYAASQARKKEENSPFAGLQGLLDDED